MQHFEGGLPGVVQPRLKLSKVLRGAVLRTEIRYVAHAQNLPEDRFGEPSTRVRGVLRIPCEESKRKNREFIPPDPRPTNDRPEE